MIEWEETNTQGIMKQRKPLYPIIQKKEKGKKKEEKIQPLHPNATD